MANPTQLEVWLQGFPREEAEVRVTELERELESLRDAIALHDRFSVGSNGNGPTDDAASAAPANRPEGIRRVLREAGGKPLASGEIKETMIKRGWLLDNEQHVKRFYSAMSTMTKRGHLLRLHDGRYLLPGVGNVS